MLEQLSVATIFAKEIKRLITKEDLLKWDPNDIKIFNACVDKNSKGLEDVEFHPRLLVDALKNFPDELDFFFRTFPNVFYMSDPPSYIFRDIIDIRTFDVYKKHNIQTYCLETDGIPRDQLDYIFRIGYIDQNKYNRALYGDEISSYMENNNITYEEYLKIKEKESEYEREDDERQKMDNEDYGVNKWGGYCFDREDDEGSDFDKKLKNQDINSIKTMSSQQSMSVQEQLLNLYLLNLQQTSNDYRSSNDETDPTLYNSLFHLCKYYESIGRVPEEHRSYLRNAIVTLFDKVYGDYLADNEDMEACSFTDFLYVWSESPFEESYGGNGSYSIYLLILNTLKKIYRLFK